MKNKNDEKYQKIGEHEYHYSTNWIYSLESEKHWRLYWTQLNLMKNDVKPDQHVLEIGVGSGFTANYLRSKGVRVTTIDIDPEKKPDIVSNIVTFNWADFKYDHLLGFEVFEHIPLQEFLKLLPHLASSFSGYLFFSIPKNERTWLHMEIQLPKLGNRTLRLTTKKNKITTKHHFWEIDAGMTYKELTEHLKKSSLKISAQETKFSRLFLKVEMA